jgi:hypothetical protein
VAVERARASGRLEAPDVAQQLGLGEDAPRVGREPGEQRELQGAQLDALAGHADLAGAVSISIAPTRWTRRVVPWERRWPACRTARWCR